MFIERDCFWSAILNSRNRYKIVWSLKENWKLVAFPIKRIFYQQKKVFINQKESDQMTFDKYTRKHYHRKVLGSRKTSFCKN